MNMDASEFSLWSRQVETAASRQSRSAEVFAVTLALATASFVFVVMRILSRFWILKRARWDDYLIILAWILGFGMSFSICLGTKYGFGKHTEFIPPEWFPDKRKIRYAFTLLYNPALMATKSSILIFYLTLSESYKFFKFSSLLTLAIVNIAGLVLTLLIAFQCRPPSAAYTTSINVNTSAGFNATAASLAGSTNAAEGRLGVTCIDTLVVYYASAPINIVTDLAIFFLPMPVLTAMRLPARQKWILAIVFGMGGFVTIVDVVRIAYFQKASATSNDFDWTGALSFMWSSVEVHVGIICACVPTLKPLATRFLPAALGAAKRKVSSVANGSRPASKERIENGYFEKPKRKISRLVDHRKDLPEIPESKIISDSAFDDSIDQGKPWEMDEDGFVSGLQPLPPPQSPTTAMRSWQNSHHRQTPTTLSPPVSPASPSEGRHSRAGSRVSFQDGSAPGGGAGTQRSQETARDEEEGGILDFITAIATIDLPPAELAKTNTIRQPLGWDQNGKPTDFDFYNLPGSKGKSAIRMTGRESLGPLAVVTTLFFIWGFAYGLLDVLTRQFSTIINTTPGQNTGLHSAYFAAYFVAPLTFAGYVLKRYGFRATFILGLVIYACGCLTFWPSAVLSSYTGFVISNFMTGLGLATLETAANPFIALCGPPQYWEARLNLSQGIQAIGSVLSPILAQRALFGGVRSQENLVEVQWAYLGIAFAVVAIAVCFWYASIPEIPDADLEDLVADYGGRPEGRKLSTRIFMWSNLGFATFSQFCYVGAQEAFAGAFVPYLAQNAGVSTYLYDGFNYQSVGQSVFAIGRFLTGFLMFFLTPRLLLLLSTFGSMITAAILTSSSTSISHTSRIALTMLTYLFQSGSFSTIFAMGLRSLGKHTKTGAIFLTAAISGGAIFPVGSSFTIVHGAMGPRGAMIVATIAYAMSGLWALWCNVVPRARRWVDPPPPSDAIEGANAVGLWRGSWSRKNVPRLTQQEEKTSRRNSVPGEISDPGGLLAVPEPAKKNGDHENPSSAHLEDVGGLVASSSH